MDTRAQKRINGLRQQMHQDKTAYLEAQEEVKSEAWRQHTEKAMHEIASTVTKIRPNERSARDQALYAIGALSVLLDAWRVPYKTIEQYEQLQATLKNYEEQLEAMNLDDMAELTR